MFGREIFTRNSGSSGPTPPIDCPTPTTILTQAWDSTANIVASQNDPGGFGVFSQAWGKFSFTNGALLTDLHWTGGYQTETEGRRATGWTIAFYNDSAGIPGTLAQTEVFTPALANETSVGVVGATHVFTYSVVFTNNFIADPGVPFWVSVIPDVIFPPQWGWSTSGVATGVSWEVNFGSPSDPGRRLAFDLTGCVGS